MKVAFITGITGQDGSYLAELLLEKGYMVHGLIRRCSSINTHRIEHIFHNQDLFLHYGDLTDSSCLGSILSNIKQKYENIEVLEIYNLGAQSHVKVSFEMPEYTADADAFGTLKLLEAIRSNNLCSKARFYQASTSELYGLVQEIPQKETTPFYPRSPYGVAKLYSYWIVKNYRESYNMFACNGILFNHESERRGHNFVTRKITRGLGKILSGETDKLVMGNIDSERDWGHAKDYVYGMWLMLQQDKPDDYVLATNVTTSIKDFIIMCFKYKNIELEWKGSGLDEIAINKENGEKVVEIDSKYFRPSEVNYLLGSAMKAKKELGWVPKYNLDSMIKDMFEY